MKLKEFKEKIDKMYELYGDVEIIVYIKNNDDTYISFQDSKGEYFNPNDDIKYIMLEDIRDISETYSDVEMKTVNGICISSYEIENSEDE